MYIGEKGFDRRRKGFRPNVSQTCMGIWGKGLCTSLQGGIKKKPLGTMYRRQRV